MSNQLLQPSLENDCNCFVKISRLRSSPPGRAERRYLLWNSQQMHTNKKRTKKSGTFVWEAGRCITKVGKDNRVDITPSIYSVLYLLFIWIWFILDNDDLFYFNLLCLICVVYISMKQFNIYLFMPLWAHPDRGPPAPHGSQPWWWWWRLLAQASKLGLLTLKTNSINWIYMNMSEKIWCMSKVKNICIAKNNMYNTRKMAFFYYYKASYPFTYKFIWKSK